MSSSKIVRLLRAAWTGDTNFVRPTDQTLSCTARARVPKPERHAARLHVRRANARRVTPSGFDSTSRLGRRAEAGPCQLLRRVRRRRFLDSRFESTAVSSAAEYTHNLSTRLGRFVSAENV